MVWSTKTGHVNHTQTSLSSRRLDRQSLDRNLEDESNIGKNHGDSVLDIPRTATSDTFGRRFTLTRSVSEGRGNRLSLTLRVGVRLDRARYQLIANAPAKLLVEWQQPFGILVRQRFGGSSQQLNLDEGRTSVCNRGRLRTQKERLETAADVFHSRYRGSVLQSGVRHAVSVELTKHQNRAALERTGHVDHRHWLDPGGSSRIVPRDAVQNLGAVDRPPGLRVAEG